MGYMNVFFEHFVNTSRECQSGRFPGDFVYASPGRSAGHGSRSMLSRSM